MNIELVVAVLEHLYPDAVRGPSVTPSSAVYDRVCDREFRPHITPALYVECGGERDRHFIALDSTTHAIHCGRCPATIAR